MFLPQINQQGHINSAFDNRRANPQMDMLSQNYHQMQNQMFQQNGMNANMIDPTMLNVIDSGLGSNQVYGQPAPNHVDFMPGMMAQPFGSMQQTPQDFNASSMGPYSHIGSAGVGMFNPMENMPMGGMPMGGMSMNGMPMGGAPMQLGGKTSNDVVPIRLNFNSQKKN